MSDSRSADRDALWPRPTSRFKLILPGDDLPAIFEDASGLESETQIITKRPASPETEAGKIHMPGLGKVGSIILSGGTVSAESAVWKWLDQSQAKSTRRSTLTIELVDNSDRAATRWILSNAWPTQVSIYGVESEGNEVAVESVEIAYETLEIQAP
ncbi:MAG: phage tail protein [Verrucomicrobia bacterium]|nr:phage tail protein [Verrucomicrobiota bacterium]